MPPGLEGYNEIRLTLARFLALALEFQQCSTISSRAKRLHLTGELVLALVPTMTVLGVFALVEVFSRQRLLFASLAASAFLIYLDPQHGMNATRTLVVSQMLAAGIGLGGYLALGPGY